MPHNDVWGDVDLGPDESRTLDFGTLRLVLRRTPTEVWLRTQRTPRDPDPRREDWLRWVAGPETRVSLRPAVPDRLLVVSHEYLYHLPPHGESRIYVRIPLFVQVTLSGEERGSGPRSDVVVADVVVADVPSMVLSDTWWGTVTEGELAYWLTTTARVSLTDDLFLPHVGMCPIHLVNHAPHALPVDRFAVRVPHLSLFSDGDKNWTDEVSVRYAGSPEGSEIRFGGRPPSEAPGARLVTAPRVPLDRGFHARTFDRLKSLSGLGV